MEVNGLIHSSDSGFKFPDGSIQTAAASPVDIPDLMTPSRIHIGDTSLLPDYADGPMAFKGIMFKPGLTGCFSVLQNYSTMNLNNFPSGSYVMNVPDGRGDEPGSVTIIKRKFVLYSNHYS